MTMRSMRMMPRVCVLIHASLSFSFVLFLYFRVLPSHSWFLFCFFAFSSFYVLFRHISFVSFLASLLVFSMTTALPPFLDRCASHPPSIPFPF
jgi:hypothetical protein